MEENENRFGDVWDQIKQEWDKTQEKTKEDWDDLVERVVDNYAATADWADDKIHEAKGYLKGRYDKMESGSSEDDWSNEDANM